MIQRSSRTLIGSLLLVASGLGCTLSPAPVDHFYRLRSAGVDARFESPRLRGTLRVNRPRTEALTDGTNLIYRRADNPAEVHREPYEYWTDSPSVLVRDVLIDALDASQIAERIVPAGLRSSVDFALSTRIVKMERLVESSSERVSLDLEFSLVRERDRQLLFHERLRDEERVQGTGAAEAVEAYDRALTRILEQLMKSLDESLPVESAGLPSWRL